MPDTQPEPLATALGRKFVDPEITAKGDRRASVQLVRLKTLWFNTGSLCNITCTNCYMESSPHNDQLSYISAPEVRTYLDDAEGDHLPIEEIGLTGGEPFMNKDLPVILAECLSRGYRVLVLTNAMKPMHHYKDALLRIQSIHGGALRLRVSIDHYRGEDHEAVRGTGTWAPMLSGLRWLSENRFCVDVAGRKVWDESEESLRAGYQRLFAAESIAVDAFDPAALVLFPEMDLSRDVPEISVHCWDILGVRPESMMCASSRMVIKRKDASHPVVVPCTLLPYDSAFELGRRLADAHGPIKLNHPYCAQFCVLGGASCSPD